MAKRSTKGAGGARPGAGRKPSVTPNKRQVPTKVSVETLEKLDELSARYGYPKSIIIEYAIAQIDELPPDLLTPPEK